METASHYLSEFRKSPGEVLLMDTGDVMTGTLATQMEYKGVIGGAMMEFMNLLSYDAWCFGNHAFDKGQENAKGLERLANFPAVLTNIVYKENGELFAKKPYVILEKAGLKIGVIGVMEETFLTEVDKRHTVGLEVLPIALRPSMMKGNRSQRRCRELMWSCLRIISLDLRRSMAFWSNHLEET
jgi:2',3'-cyclic-nucleotide 2'-phosphodiesterase (5'-nucleotidase family)